MACGSVLKVNTKMVEKLLMIIWWFQNLWESVVERCESWYARLKTTAFEGYIPVLMSYHVAAQEVNVIYNKDNWIDMMYALVFRYAFGLEPPMIRYDDKAALEKFGTVLVYCTYCAKNAHKVYHMSFGEGEHIECERHSQHQDVAFITAKDMRQKFDISYLFNTVGKMLISKDMNVTPAVLAHFAATLFDMNGLQKHILGTSDYELYVINFNNPVWKVYKRDEVILN